ncbi:MAG: DUF4912 domain-containing protein [Treponema sp.]|jgi:hypothetical protein|nr:DUF4912 domain-containing protein [Treponema sp.]
MNDLLCNNPVMKIASLKRPYLESLTTHELVRLADGFGIEIPPELERVFIITEIIDITAEYAFNESGSAPRENPPLRETAIPEPVSLPKQYHITFIEVLLRDPLWVFTFWEIKSAEKELHENAGDFKGYQLKVSPLDPAGRSSKDDSFTVSVGAEDTAWYLGFPPGGGRFQVELCVLRGGESLGLAVSHPFTLPPWFNPAKPGSTAPLIRLSGVEDFQVLRNEDRLSRMKATR